MKQEPLSDDECHSEDGYAYDGDNDPFDEEDTFVHSNISVSFQFDSFVFSLSIFMLFIYKLCSIGLGDYDGSDNEYDEDNNEYDNSESKDYGCAHWERKNLPDLSNVKEEKV